MEKQTSQKETILDDIADGAWFLLNNPSLGFRDCRQWLEKEALPIPEDEWLFMKAAIATVILNKRFGRLQ